MAHYEAAWGLFPDVLPTLEALAATHRHAVLSNSSITVQEHKLRALGLLDRFEAVLCAAEAGLLSVWIDRGASPARDAGDVVVHRIAGLSELPALLRSDTRFGAPSTFG
ncbi:hypothetical protein DV517_69680 [Streptomyces sp. S816]|nr:hypothetical protein DV517_69680 [Streptomyces sp. S816]